VFLPLTIADRWLFDHVSMLLGGTFLAFPHYGTPRGILETLKFLLLAKYNKEPMYRPF